MAAELIQILEGLDRCDCTNQPLRGLGQEAGPAERGAAVAKFLAVTAAALVAANFIGKRFRRVRRTVAYARVPGRR